MRAKPQRAQLAWVEETMRLKTFDLSHLNYMRHFLHFIIFLFVLLFLGACRSSLPQPEPLDAAKLLAQIADKYKGIESYRAVGCATTISGGETIISRYGTAREVHHQIDYKKNDLFKLDWEKTEPIHKFVFLPQIFGIQKMKICGTKSTKQFTNSELLSFSNNKVLLEQTLLPKREKTRKEFDSLLGATFKLGKETKSPLMILDSVIEVNAYSIFASYVKDFKAHYQSTDFCPNCIVIEGNGSGLIDGLIYRIYVDRDRLLIVKAESEYKGDRGDHYYQMEEHSSIEIQE